ncbi:MAG: T9SS type A sorting domain-containing protein, partial [Bacteroidales bacterium]|nr:T9SS type A sorting domain-containing protein [Bacteroidales bacterium]
YGESTKSHSDLSNGWSFTTEINNPPTPPTNPSPSNGAVDVSLNPTISWSCSDPDGDAISYEFQYKKGSLGSWQKVTTTNKSYKLSGLEFDQTYYWKVTATDVYGESTKSHSDLSNGWSFTTEINNPPTPPTNPSPSNGAVDVSINPTLSWSCSDPDGDAVRYELMYAVELTSGSLSSWKKIQTNDKTYNLSGLELGYKYYWKVFAYDEHNAEAKSHKDNSNGWFFVTEKGPAKLRMTVQNDFGEPQANALVYLYEKQDTVWKKIESNYTDSNGITPYWILPEGNYNAEVYYDEGDEQEFWHSVWNEDKGEISLKAGEWHTYSTFRSEPYVEKYEVYDNNTNEVIERQQVEIGSNLTHKVLIRNRSYVDREVVLKMSLNNDKNTDWKYSVGPFNVPAHSSLPFEVTQIVEASGVFFSKFRVETLVHTYTLTDWVDWQVSYVGDDNGLIIINAEIEDEDYKVYPNPTTGKVYIKGNNFECIKVYNIEGKIIQQTNGNSDEAMFDLSNQEKGLYLIQITENEKVVNRKIILK